MCCNRKGGQMDDNDHSISFLTRCSCFEQQVSWRSVWCCLKSQGHTILWSTVWTVSFFWFLGITCMIFFFVVKEREGENFDLKISWVDFGITFFKNEKEIKKYWRWQLGGICIQKSNWVEYSAYNLENTYWSNCLSKVYFSAWKKNYTGWNKRNGVQFASLDFCFTL